MELRNAEADGVPDPVADAGERKPARRRRALRVASATGLALGLAAGGAAVAGAATSGSSEGHSQSGSQPPAGGMRPNGGTPPAAVGTVATVGASSFTLKTKDGTTVTVDVSGTTTYRDRDVSSPTLADVTVGKTVAAFGTDTSNTVTATSVAIGVPNGPGGRNGTGGPGGHPGTGGPEGPPPGE